MRFEFLVRSGREIGRTVAVSTGQTLSLGRLKESDVVIDDEAASRRHCTITAREDGIAIADLQSANGTFVQPPGSAPFRALPAEPVVIRPGTRITVGERWLRYESHREGK